MPSTPNTVGIPKARAKMAICELVEPLPDTMPASLPSGTSANAAGVTSSPTRMVFSGK